MPKTAKESSWIARQLGQAGNGDKIEPTDYLLLLRACTKAKDLHQGTIIHEDILRRGLLKHYSDSLVTMYAKCGALSQAKELFDAHKTKDVFTWTALIVGYCQKGQNKDALHHFNCMQQEGLSPNAVTYTCMLKACGSIGSAEEGEKIHKEISKKGLLRYDAVLGNALLDMYVKCGAMDKAWHMLKDLPMRNVVSWNTLITGYAQQRIGAQAIDCYEEMQRDGLLPNTVTFISILKACGSSKAVEKGKEIHDAIANQGLLGTNSMLGTALVDMYAKCGDLITAAQVLEELPDRNAISWSALMAGYAEHGDGEQALKCFEAMRREGLSPDAATFACLLKACGSIGAADKGERIHDEISKRGFLGHHTLLGTALVDMYAKCGALSKARQALRELPARNAIAWSAMIAGYAQQGEGEQALSCFEAMQREGFSPDAATYACVLKACGSLGATQKGERTHADILYQGFLENNIVLATSLVDMYARCGALSKARQVLEELPVRNVISWTALIAGYTKQGEGVQAINCFEQMQFEGLSPNTVTFICILKACGSIRAADKGKKYHEDIMEQRLLGKDLVLGNALVDMYAKCGALAKAQQVLQELPVRDCFSWNALIAGYARQGKGEEALTCFEQMQREGLFPNAVTFTSILKACGSIGAADKGATIHDVVAQQGLLGNNVVLGNALVDMYTKCGAPANAQQVLEELSLRDAISWSTLMGGHVQQCEIGQALRCFEQMQTEGLSPDAATLSCMLSTCSRLGLIQEAQLLIVNMSKKFGMNPDLGHYTCMIDLFGRAGYLDKALAVMEKVPCSDGGVWSALLSACGKWGDVRVARWAFERAIQVDTYNAAFYVSMANIYAAAGMQDDAEKIEAMRIENKAYKNQGMRRMA